MPNPEHIQNPNDMISLLQSGARCIECSAELEGDAPGHHRFCLECSSFLWQNDGVEVDASIVVQKKIEEKQNG